MLLQLISLSKGLDQQHADTTRNSSGSFSKLLPRVHDKRLTPCSDFVYVELLGLKSEQFGPVSAS
jgi:hypothetical protein